ncbi:MAG: YfhO family protein [Rhodothermales bacterium]
MARKAKHAGPPDLAAEGWWDRLPGRTRHGIAVAVLLIVALGFYGPVVFSGLSLIGGDTVNWRAMAEYVIEYEERTGERALWAPNAFAGMPAYMISYEDVVPQIDVIPTLLRDVVWPVSHFFFLLVGTYLLVFFLTENRLAGVMGAVAFGLTTYLAVILVAGHNSKFITLCYSPWLALAFAYVLRNPKLLSALLFAIAFGVNLRAGHVQITYYLTFLLGVWWVVELVGAFRRKEWKPMATATGYLVLGSVLGLLLVAQPYLAQFEYKQFTIRGTEGSAASGLDWSYAMGWSQGVGELITLIAADAFGGASPGYWGPKAFTQGTHYVGATVFFLAIVAVWRVRRNVVLAFAVGAGLMTLFSLGSHFELLNRFMYAYFPLFNAFRVPETWLSAVAFALAVLGAFGLHAVGTDTSEKGGKAVYAAAGGVAAILLFFWLVPGALFDFDRPNEAAQVTQQLLAENPDVSPDDPRVRSSVEAYLEEQRASRIETFQTDMLRSLIFVFLAAVSILLFRKGNLPRWAMQAAIVLLVVVDLWGVGRRYFNDDHLVRAGEVEDRIATYDFDEFINQREEAAGGMGRFRVLSLETGSPFQNARPSYHYESIGGYHGAKLRLIQEYIDELFVDPATGGPNENALDLLNTRYVIARGALPGTEVVYQSEQTGMYVLENPDALPRAFLVGEIEMADGPEAAYERLRGADFDPRRTAVLYESVDIDPVPIDSSSTARVDMVSYAPDEIVLDAETDAPRLLILSEMFYPAGWDATVDGEDAPIYRANHLLRAVPVPEGSHRVELRFDPSSHRIGVRISAVSTVFVYGLTLGLLGFQWYRRRRKDDGNAQHDE